MHGGTWRCQLFRGATEEEGEEAGAVQEPASIRHATAATSHLRHTPPSEWLLPPQLGILSTGSSSGLFCTLCLCVTVAVYSAMPPRL